MYTTHASTRTYGVTPRLIAEHCYDATRRSSRSRFQKASKVQRPPLSPPPLPSPPPPSPIPPPLPRPPPGSQPLSTSRTEPGSSTLSLLVPCRRCGEPGSHTIFCVNEPSGVGLWSMRLGYIVLAYAGIESVRAIESSGGDHIQVRQPHATWPALLQTLVKQVALCVWMSATVTAVKLHRCADAPASNQWLSFWIIYVIITTVEHVSDVLLSWVPVYYQVNVTSAFTRPPDVPISHTQPPDPRPKLQNPSPQTSGRSCVAYPQP